MERALPLAPAQAPVLRTIARLRPALALHPATWHIAFWLVHVLNELLIAIVEERPLAEAVRPLVMLYVALAIPAYVNLLLFVPRLWRRGRRVLSSVAAIAVSAAVAALYIEIVRHASPWNVYAMRAELRWTFTALLYIVSVAGVDLAARYVRTMRQESERRLEHLRAQLNPHFLFNTINSLYALAIAQSPDLPRLMLQHAELLRYALDHTRQERVPLTLEIDFMAAYVEVERLRHEAARIRLDVLGAVHAQQIAPMLFAPLVENCFKHLGATDRFIDILLEVEARSLRLTLRNSCDDALPSRAGIGLHNTRERLALLYPGRHSLETRRDDGIFEAVLAVQL
ncbi:MAG TPA: histidine kinase [Thermoanaerobaculia bacterium]|nr:histidine kinase [Thermoanaerobaculia bacterium]